MLGIVAGQTGNWLLTSHPDASGVRVALVRVQLFVGIAFFIRALGKERRIAAAEKARGRVEGG